MNGAGRSPGHIAGYLAQSNLGRTVAAGRQYARGMPSNAAAPGVHPPNEQYLEAILYLEEEGSQVIQARLAEHVGHSAPTVSEMVHRLKEAGYVEEMAAIENALAEGRQADIPSLMSDRWLADATLFGPATTVRDGVMAWREAGVTTPILVPSSVTGNQLTAVEEIFAAFA